MCDIFLIAMMLMNIGCSFVSEATSASTFVPNFHAVIPRQQLSSAKKLEILKSVKSLESEYDSREAMLLKNLTSSPSPNHLAWKGDQGHPTKDSAVYAVNLLDCEDKTMETRAFDILRKILLLQDTRNNSRTHGLWPYYLEEPMETMAHPDWNWADVIATQLLQVVINHNERLPIDLATNIGIALVYAARSIQKRNVGLSYSSMVIMGAHVTLAVGDIYNIVDLQQYATRRLETFLNFTKTNGGFEEYNSPSYTATVIDDLGRLRMHAVTSQSQQLANELYYIGWKEIVDHYHATTGQWSGPHSRSYRTLLGGGHTIFLRKAMNNELDPRLPIPVPEDLRQILVSNTIIPHTITNSFAKGVQGVRPDLIGTTHHEVSWTLGSVNWGEMWTQRRPLVAYWGTKAKPSFFRLRFLHDGDDFSDAQFFSVQKQGQVLAGLVLATDGGDKHVSIDKIKNATIVAHDLRLRFEIGGADAEHASTIVPSLKNPIKFKFDNVSLQITLQSVSFDNITAQYFNVTKDTETFNIDYILFNGVQRPIKLDTLKTAAVIVAVQFSNSEIPWIEPIVTLQDQSIHAKWQDVCFQMKTKPDTVAQLRKTIKYGC